MGAFSGTWAPGEHLVLEALGKRFSAFWTAQERAEGFLKAYPELDMEVSSLEIRSLRAAFLQALNRLRVEGVLVDYTPGAHQAGMVLLEELLEEVKNA